MMSGSNSAAQSAAMNVAQSRAAQMAAAQSQSAGMNMAQSQAASVAGSQSAAMAASQNQVNTANKIFCRYFLSMIAHDYILARKSQHKPPLN